MIITVIIPSLLNLRCINKKFYGCSVRVHKIGEEAVNNGFMSRS